MKKKSIIMLICGLMIMFVAALGTIAYMSDRATVSNRFTVGNIDIVVDETEVNENGNPIPNPDYDPNDPENDHPDKRTEEANVYPLVPGSEYVKDPTLTIRAGSDEAFLRMVVTISNAAELREIFTELQAAYPTSFPNGFDPGALVTGRNNTVWVYTGTMKEDTALNTYTLEFRYPAPVKAGTEDITFPPLFETILLPGELTYDHLKMLQTLTIDVQGHAIQTAGFADADAAWNAFSNQLSAMGGNGAITP